MPTVFICRDHSIDTILEALCTELSGRGIRVLRGPPNQPGRLEPIEPAWIAEADVAMFSSRWRVPASTLSAAPALRAIVNPTIGLETIDIEAASRLGIIVGHGATPENYISMSEAAFMLILNLMYGLARTQGQMRVGAAKAAPHARMLHGATVGILGLGRIGRALASRLNAFGARVLAYSPSADAASLPKGVTVSSLEAVMRESDTIAVCIAVRPENRHLVNERTLALMKSSAYLINVARGDAIDEPALIQALSSGHIAGAALDTFAVEPLPASSPLRRMENVIITPHSVGHTVESVESLVPAAIDNILRVLQGQLPRHCRNPEVEPLWRMRLSRLAQPDPIPNHSVGLAAGP